MDPVYDKARRPVEAKPLVDQWGNGIINPHTGQPFIAPAGYDPNAAIAEGHAIRAMVDRALAEGASEAVVMQVLAQVLLQMFYNFYPGGPQDLQRSYNGMTNGGKWEFVEDFAPAASFNFGLFGAAAGFNFTQLEMAGGVIKFWGTRLRLPRSPSTPLSKSRRWCIAMAPALA